MLTLLRRALNTHRRRVLNEYIYNRIEKSTSTRASSHGDLRSVTSDKFVVSHRRAYSTSAENDAKIVMDLHRNGSKDHQTRSTRASVNRSKSFETRRVKGFNHMSSVTEKVLLKNSSVICSMYSLPTYK